MILALAALLVQADAGDLFKRMAKAVDEAPSLRAESRADITRDGSACAATWKLRVRGDRARLECAMTRDGDTREARLFIAGARCVEFEGPARLDPQDVHHETARRLAAASGRIGLAGLSLLASTARYDKKGKNDIPDASSLSFTDFALAGEEETAGRKAWKITYRAAPRNASVPPLAVTAWIDRERSLPLRFSIATRERDTAVTITESVTVLELNYETSDAEFQAPEK